MQNHFLRTLILPLMLLGIVMVFLRNLYTGTISYHFLIYNLILGSISFVISKMLLLPYFKNASIMRSAILFPLWLLFLPNAPYLVTDLLHLSESHPRFVWFDTLMIFCFALTGLYFGIMSIRDMSQIFYRHFGRKYQKYFESFSLFSSAFGMYLGRYHRFNSWDLANHPFSLLNAIAERFAHPADHPRTWGMTLLFGVFLHIVYYSFAIDRATETGNVIAHE